ncbi:hypothetical protein [Castellaniella caeni]|uniref:hypothetical protein n=1 Tax=Castellaniella caeni TaxID=266123 RepID=UPI0012EE5CFE|nr:hypothetical protein [Castellaniella caeni]
MAWDSFRSVVVERMRSSTSVTRADWQRIVDNQEKLYGKPKQLDMVQRLLIS